MCVFSLQTPHFYIYPNDETMSDIQMLNRALALAYQFHSISMYESEWF